MTRFSHYLDTTPNTTAATDDDSSGTKRSGLSAGDVIVSEADVKNPPTSPHSGEEKLFWKYTISGNTATTKGRMSHKTKREKNEAGIFFSLVPERQTDRQAYLSTCTPCTFVCDSPLTCGESTCLSLCYLRKRPDGCRFKVPRATTCVFQRHRSSK